MMGGGGGEAEILLNTTGTVSLKEQLDGDQNRSIQEIPSFLSLLVLVGGGGTHPNVTPPHSDSYRWMCVISSSHTL